MQDGPTTSEQLLDNWPKLDLYTWEIRTEQNVFTVMVAYSTGSMTKNLGLSTRSGTPSKICNLKYNSWNLFIWIKFAVIAAYLKRFNKDQMVWWKTPVYASFANNNNA